MTETTKKEYPKFNWDYDVPDTPFWKDLPFTTARNFLTCYADDELAAMSFPDSMAKEDKYKLLLSRLLQKESATKAQYAPTPLYEANLEIWMKHVLARFTMHKELKDYESAEAALQEMTDHGSYNSKMSAKNILADLYGEYGRYAEAEAMGRDCLAWLRDMPTMGSHSPQALGCERRLMGVIWKQGKYEEAKAMQEELKELVEGLPGTEFEKYLDDERTMLAELVVSLDEWRDEQQGDAE